MSLQHAIDALTSERETLLAQVKVLTSEAAKLTEAISLIQGVTTSTPPIPSGAAPTSEAQHGQQAPREPPAAETARPDRHKSPEEAICWAVEQGYTHLPDILRAAASVSGISANRLYGFGRFHLRTVEKLAP